MNRQMRFSFWGSALVILTAGVLILIFLGIEGLNWIMAIGITWLVGWMLLSFTDLRYKYDNWRFMHTRKEFLLMGVFSPLCGAFVAGLILFSLSIDLSIKLEDRAKSKEAEGTT